MKSHRVRILAPPEDVRSAAPEDWPDPAMWKFLVQQLPFLRGNAAIPGKLSSPAQQQPYNVLRIVHGGRRRFNHVRRLVNSPVDGMTKSSSFSRRQESLWSPAFWRPFCA